MSTLFSIPFHQDDGIIKNVCENIFQFCPEAIIIAHLTKGLETSYKHEKLFVNPIHLNTGFMDGSLLYVHLENFKLALSLELDFDYFIPFASNQMFIKKGLEKNISKYSCSEGVCDAHKDIQMKIFMKEDIARKVFKITPEGTFYKKELFSLVCEEISKKIIDNYDFNLKYIYMTQNGYRFRRCINYSRRALTKLFGFEIGLYIFPKSLLHLTYASEETYLPTISAKYTKPEERGQKYCYIAWNNPSARVSIEDVVRILEYEKYFSVKRVERNINDEVRNFINGLG